MSQSIERRTFLRGLGTLMALPVLESVMPAGVRAAAEASKAGAASHPLRTAFIYTPNGAIMPRWTPKGEGANWELSPTMASLKNVKSDLQVITGLEHQKADANGDGGGDHARATATFLTGIQARKTAGADISLGVSVDQVLARQVGNETRLESLQLGCDQVRKAGRCDSGYSCAYQFNFSWRDENMPLPPEVDPRLVFEKLFGSYDKKESKESREKRMRHQNSLLDFVMEDAKSLQGRLGYTDTQKLDEYLTGVRDLERKIEHAEKFAMEMPDVEKPAGIPDGYRDYIRLMYDLLVLSFQTDSTRVASFLVAHDGSNRSFPDMGVPDGHHHLSHHRDDQEKINKIAKIDQFYMEQFAYFLEKMKTVKEADGSNLLDHSMIVFGSGISDANRHDHHNLPVILAGKGNGALRPGRHLVTKQNVPMTNLYLSLADRVGAKVDRIGDSTGRFDLV